MSVDMKDSGVSWIEKVPKHWKIIPFKAFYSLSKGLSITKADLVEKGLPVISYGQIHSKINTGTKINDLLIRYVPESYLASNKSCIVNEGDIIFADTSEDLEGCGNCIYIDRNIELFAGYHTIIARNIRKEKNKYLSYLFQTDCWRIRANVNGVKLFSIPQKLLSTTDIILPPKEEQTRIANFLDKKCAEIDELIALQDQMIAQLATYKQAVITETVTKGLEPNVKMKDSGVEWIGEIPEHWNIVPLKFLGRTQNGISKGGDYFGEGSPFVNYGDIYKNYFIGSNDASGLAKSTIEDQKSYSVLKGDIFFTRTSETIEEIGFSCACIETIKNATFSGFLIRFRPYPEVLYPLFSGFYFRSTMHRQYFVKEMNIVTRTSLGQDLLKGLPVLLPPLLEQQSIAQYLDQKCKEIDELISIKKEKIEQLKAYKKSVIYEYVTGKKQVN